MVPYEEYFYDYGMVRNSNGKHRIVMSSESKSQKQKSKEAAKKHAVAEQWRRWRINSHLKELRELLHPNITSKTVKASILTKTVHRLNELRKRAAELGLQQDEQRWFCGGGAASESWPPMFPGEIDEATVSNTKYGEENMVKATVCCEDRPALNRDLTEAIRTVGARVVKAEMATIGGRTRAEVVVRWPEGGGGGEDDMRSLKMALKALVENRALGCSDLGQLLGVNGHARLGLEKPNNKRAAVCGFTNSNWVWEQILSNTL